MRFLPEGPIVPDQLLEERDLGKVVFFCGAGVSLSSGMPTFPELTRYVVRELGAPEDAQSRKTLDLHNDPGLNPAGLPAFDHIFNLLQQEYSASEIDYQIARRLRTRPNASLVAHETVLRLSKSAEGKAQIVTTNFDLLFEKAATSPLKRFAPPALPDLASGQSLDGLVYLHGRLNSRMRRGDGRQGFVISSSDFGRAYLAEGWATRFVRDLLDQYTVVLLGYSANDPPVRYLLQGLHTRNQGPAASIYVFDSGTEEDVHHRWRDSGVIPLSYARTDADHSTLWNTLSAWAERADDHIQWRENIVKLAQRGPKLLTATQRGQVASVVRTNVGAKLFASAHPPPPGEWLCVFDVHMRYADIGRSFDVSVPDFDPLIEYGLDDDPPRPPKSDHLKGLPGDDLLRHTQSDRQNHSTTRLAGIARRWADPPSNRLYYLAQWIAKVLGEPVTAWWAARYPTLHPALLNQIELNIRSKTKELPANAKFYWTILIEKFQIGPEDDLDDTWYETRRRIQAEGWNKSVVRSFARATQPYLKSDIPYGIRRAQPPEGNWQENDFDPLIRFEVAFPLFRNDKLEIPAAVVPQIYRTLRGHLEYAAGLLSDIGQRFWRTSSFYPEDKPGHGHVDEASAYLLEFRRILDQVVERQPKLILSDIVSWPEEEPYFFDKLRLYVWTKQNLFSGEFVGGQLLANSNEAFWNFYTRRELLFLLRERWSDFPAALKQKIADLIVSGRNRYEGEEENEYLEARTGDAVTMLGWLQSNGCVLSQETQKSVAKLRLSIPGWEPSWDYNAAIGSNIRFGGVQTVSDPNVIVNLPLHQVIPAATDETREPAGEFVHFRPFNGLIAQRPTRAVAALTHVSRSGMCPIQFWRSTLNNWPENTSIRLTRLFAERLGRLPKDVVLELRLSLFTWTEKHLRLLAQREIDSALHILDMLLDKLFQGGKAATSSSMGDTSISRENLNLSRRTYGHAINSPVGDSAQLLLTILSDMKPEKGAGLPNNIQTRIERLIAAPGEGQDHAICVFTRDTKWLDFVDPVWVEKILVPCFDLDNELAEPAWNGFLHSLDLPRPELFAKLKPNFLAVVARVSQWAWSEDPIRRLQELLVLGCFWHQNEPAYINFGEARSAMQVTDDTGRAHCLWFLTRIVKEAKEWRKFGKPFLEKAWPRELRYQTEATTAQFVMLAEESGDLFPEVVDTVLPYLSPVSKTNMMIYKLNKQDEEDGSGLATRFPRHALALLNKIVSDEANKAPYDFSIVVDMIGEADFTLQQDPRWRRLKRIALSV